MIKQKKHPDYYFEDSPVWKAIVHMSVPMILGMCLTVIYDLIDAYFIGQLNQTPMLSAVALALPFLTLQMGIGNLFGTGGSTRISRLLGEKKHAEAAQTASVTFYYSLFAGLALLAIGLPLLQPILHLLGAQGDTLAPTGSFIAVLLIGSPVIISNFALVQVVRAEGASKISMAGMAISVVVNIALDPVLIFIFHMDVAGAAAATVIGHLCAMVFLIYYLHKKSPHLGISPKLFKPTKVMSGEIFKIGVSALVMDSFMIVTSLLYNNFAALYGDFALAAFGVSQRLAQLSDLIGMGLSMGIVPLVAYNFAAKSFGRMKKAINITSVAMTILIAAVAAAMLVWRTQLIGLFSTDPQVISIGSLILAALLISSLFTSFTTLFTGIFQGMGRAKESAIMSILQGGLMIPAMIVGNLFWGLNGVIWSTTAAEVVACTIGVCLWLRFKATNAFKEPLPAQEA